MELLKQLVPVLLSASLALLVVGAAMGSSRGEFVYVLRRPRLLARAVIAVDVIPVLAAIAVIALFPGVSLPTKAAILLMAISPVPPLVPGKALKFGGRAEYVYGLQVAMALLAIVTVPLLGVLTAAYYDSEARFPIAVVAGNIVAGLIVPLAFGIVLRTFLPDFSRRTAHWVLVAANVLVLLAFVPILAGTWRRILDLIGDGSVLAMILVIVIAIAGAHLLGGRRPGDRSTLVFATAMRHPGIALALAGANHADKAISAGVLLFLLVGILTLAPYQLWLRRSAAADSGLGTDDAAKADV